AAPGVNVIARLKEWTRTTRVVSRELSGAAPIRVAYWASFGEFLANKNAPFRIRRTNRRYWFNFPIGRAGFWISALISTEHQWVRDGLNIRHDADKTAFDALYIHKSQIEAEFGEALEWQRLPRRMASRVVLFRYDSNVSDQDQWDELHAWMLSKMERFRSVFAQRV